MGKVFGYDMRKPSKEESDFFKESGVPGYAADDGTIVIDPDSKLTPEQRDALAVNEASRLFMREQGYKFDFDLTPEQSVQFKDSVYGKPGNENHAKSSIIGRIISGDPSALNATQEQLNWAERVKHSLMMRNTGSRESY